MLIKNNSLKIRHIPLSTFLRAANRTVFCRLHRLYIWPFSQDHAIEEKKMKSTDVAAGCCRSGLIKLGGLMGMAQTADKPAYELKRTVVMVGMMGCGKTAIGRALALQLGVPFLDSDDEIERAANAAITEIFTRDGEAFFRKREAEVIQRLLVGPAGILSTGGGAFLQPQNRDAIDKHGVSVWLDAPLPLLWERVRHKNTRPLLQTDDPLATLTALFEARNPVYAQAGVRIEVQPKASIDQTTTQVIAALSQHPDILETTR